MKNQLSRLWLNLCLIASFFFLPFQNNAQQVIEGLKIMEVAKSRAAVDLKNYLPENQFDLKPISTNKDQFEIQHARFQLQLNGIPLKGLHLTQHELAHFNRIIMPANIPAADQLKSLQTRLDEQQVRALARKEVPAEAYGQLGIKTVEKEAVSLVYVPKNYDWKESEWILAYEVDVFSKKPLQAKRVTINAETGKVIFIENRLCSIHGEEHVHAVEGTAVTKYHGTHSIETTLLDDNYVLWDQTRGDGLRTFNLNTDGGDFFDEDNFWDNFNAEEDEVAGDVHWGAAATWDYLVENFNRHGLDGQNGAVRSMVHLDDGNAFWNGFQTIYGDGGGSFDQPFTYIDIIAHEMAHGLTQHTSGLIYIRESGGLNEAFSDIIGVSVENYTFPDSVDWRLGEQLSTGGSFIRNMRDPSSIGMPDTYGGTFWTNNLEVHTGSSMANLWYHFLVEGRVGQNDLDYEYNVTGIGWDDAQQIAYHTWTNYLNPNSNYRQCAEFSLIVASDLFGECSQQVISTREAWRAVGVLPPGDEVSLRTNKRKICTLGDSINFRLNITVTDILWDFGDGNTSTEINPTHSYTENGNFTFSVTGNSCDAGPFSATSNFEILVDDSLDDCNQVVLRPNDEQIVDYCEGAVFDNGGPNGDYTNNYYSNLLVQAEGALGYDVEIVSFNTAEDDDFVQIRVDNGSGLRTQDTYSESVSPGTKFYEGTRINFSFASDNSLTAEGFEIRWQCYDDLPSPTITPSFVADLCGDEIHFSANATFSSDIDWDFGDGDTGRGINPSHTYDAQGTYTITCTAENSTGSATETFEVEVIFPGVRISGPHQLLPDTEAQYTAKFPDSLELISGIWRVDGLLAGVGLAPMISISDLGLHTIELSGQFSNLCTSKDTFVVDVVDELSATADLATPGLSIFPNPAKDYFLVKNTEVLNGHWNIQLINNLGQTMENYQASFNTEDTKQFQLPALSPSLYYLQFENEQGEKVLRKLMIVDK